MKEPSQSMKYVNLTPPGALVDNASLTVAELDTQGYDRLQVLLILGATDIACTACELTEADATGTSHAEWDGSDFNGDTEVDGTTAALPSATDDDGIFVWDVNLKNRMRFIDATITVGDGTAGGYYTVIAILSRGTESPVGVSERGAAGYLRS
jgi:hypothetical protein